MPEIEELNAFDAIAKLRDTWRALLDRTEQANFLQTFEWFQAWWRHYGEPQQDRLRFLVVTESGVPIGLMPLVVHRKPSKTGRLRILGYPQGSWGSFYHPIGPEPAQTMAAGFRHIRHTRRDWDVLEPSWVDADGTDAGRTQQALHEAGFRLFRSIQTDTSLIDIREGWEAYLKSRTSKWRNNLKRWERRLGEEGEIRHIRNRPSGADGDNAPDWALYETSEDIAARSWQAASPDGTTLSHESVRPFLRDVTRLAAELGGLDLNVMFLGDKPLAFAYNLVHRGYVIGLRIGYDPDVSKSGPGNLLYVYAIRDSCARGDTLYDMGPGSSDMKRELRSELRPIYRYTHVAALTPRALALRLKRFREDRELTRIRLSERAPG